MKEIINRVMAETPPFFKRLQHIALTLGISAFAAYSVSPAIGFDNALILSLLKYAIVACAFIAGTSQLTKVGC